MSYSNKKYRQTSSDYASPDEISDRDIDRVHNTWKDTNQTRRQFEEIQAQNRTGYTSGNLSHYITDNQELREKLRASESQLNDARDNIVILSRKLNEAEDGIRAYQDHLAKQTGVTAMKTHQLNRMTSQYEHLNLSQKEVIERSRESNLALINELDEKNREIQNLKNLSQNRVDKLSMVSVSHGQASAKIERLDEEVGEKNREIAFLKRELEDARKNIHELQQIKKSEGLALIEIEHLKADVQRLVKMLKTTKEYSEFADFADDSSGSIRFLKSSLGKTPVDINYKKMTMGGNKTGSDGVIERLCVQEALIEEKEVWTPHDAFKFAQEFRRKYDGELNDALLEKLLFEMNRIWSRREKQRVQRVQAQCAHEIMKLKRQLSQGVPFNEVQSKQTINRLRNELKNSYKENRKAFAERSEVNPPGIHYVNETLKMAKNSIKQKKLLTQENNFLRDQIKMSTLSKSNTDWKKDKELDY